MDSPPGSTARPAGIKAASGPEEPQTKSSQDSKPPDGGEANYLEDSLGSAFKLSLAMAITVPLGIVTKIAVPRYLGEELAGRFFFAENFPTVLLMFLSLGIGVYIQKTLPARREHAVDVFSPVLKLEAAFAAVLIATLVGYMKATGYDLDIICLTGFMACVQAMCVIQNDIIQKVFFAVGLTREVAIVNVVSKVVLASAVLLSLLSGAGVYGLATCFFCAQLIAMSMLLSTARNQEMLGGPFRFPVIRRVLLTGLPFFFGGALVSANSSIDAAFISKLAGFSELGFSGAAQRLTGVFLLLAPVINNAIIPALSKAYHLNRADYETVLAGAFRLLLILLLPLSTFLVCFARELIAIAFGSSFAPAASALAIGGSLVYATYVAMFLSSVLVITTNGHRLGAVLAFSVGLNALFDYIMIPLGRAAMGPGGGAAASATASLLVDLLSCFALAATARIAPLWSKATYTTVMCFLPALGLTYFHRPVADLGLQYRVAIFVFGIPGYLLIFKLVSFTELSWGARQIQKLFARRRPLFGA